MINPQLARGGEVSVLGCRNTQIGLQTWVDWGGRWTFQENGRCWVSVGLLLAQRRRRWANSKPALTQDFVLPGLWELFLPLSYPSRQLSLYRWTHFDIKFYKKIALLDYQDCFVRVWELLGNVTFAAGASVMEQLFLNPIEVKVWHMSIK